MQSMILVGVENSESRLRIVNILREAGFRVIEAESGFASITLLRRNRRIGLALLDVGMSDFQGEDLIRQIRSGGVSIPLIALVAENYMTIVQPLLEVGASDYLDINEQPLRFIHSVGLILHLVALEREIHFQRREGESGLNFSDVCGVSPLMLKACNAGRKAAEIFEPVLIEGEAGTGRETFARIIHDESVHAKGEFIRIFSADEDNENENENTILPAVTKALQRESGGTLCFVDIDGLTIETQRQILKKLIASKQSTESPQSIRFIATCGHNVQALVRDGFLDDGLVAFFSSSHIFLPTLRERRDDIPNIADRLIKRIAANLGKMNIIGIHSAAVALLMQNDWPGNISELESVLFRASVLGHGPLLNTNDFRQLVRQPKKENDSVKKFSLLDDENQIDFFNENGHIRTMAEIEDAAIDAAIKRYSGSMSEVARRLQISRSTLYRKK